MTPEGSHAPAEGRERAEARAQACRLLAALYRHGPAPHLLPELRGLPVLLEALPPSWDPEEAAAEHHELLGLSVFPVGGAFLEPDGRAGGPSAEPARAAARSLGIPAEAAGETPDHLARELELLAALVEAEEGAPERASAASRLLLDAHLLVWLPPFAVAVAREGRPFWTLLAELTLELALDHRRTLGPPIEPAPLPLADPPDLDASGTGLAAIARFLAVPVRSGVWLSAGTLRTLARRLDVPSGFGGRERVLEALLQSSARFGGGALVLQALRQELEAWRASLAAWASVPSCGPFTHPWSRRAETTSRLLEGMRERLA